MRYFESQNSEKAIYVKSLLKVGYVSLLQRKRLKINHLIFKRYIIVMYVYIILVDNLY